MKTKLMLGATEKQQGYVFLGVLVLLAVSAVVVATSLSLTSTDARTTLAQRIHSDNYYQAERSLNSALSWLRENSTSLALMFSRASFYQNFQRTSHSYGANEGSLFSVPTAIRLNGSSSSVFLTNDPNLGQMAFPDSTVDAASGAVFNPMASFADADFGSASVRITLVDAIAHEPAKDFGSPASGNPDPQTDFSPIYRIDAMQGADVGAHVFGYVVGNLVTDYGVGFFGRDLVDFRQACDSYISNNGPYGGENRRPNCSVGSDNIIQIHEQEAIYGKASTTGFFNNQNPYGGKVCADFEPGCPNPGQTCTGPTCPVIGLPNYMDWSHYCPTNRGDVVVVKKDSSGVEIDEEGYFSLTVNSDDSQQKCWNSVVIRPKQILTLKTTAFPYFIDTLDVDNAGRLNFSPNPSGGTINLYVRKFVGDKFNGNQVFNTNNKPYQLRIHYLGTDDLELNGTADINAFLIAPFAKVTVSGTFTYQGGIKARELAATGNGKLRYDESGDIATISDVTYRLRNISERFR